MIQVLVGTRVLAYTQRVTRCFLHISLILLLGWQALAEPYTLQSKDLSVPIHHAESLELPDPLSEHPIQLTGPTRKIPHKNHAAGRMSMYRLGYNRFRGSDLAIESEKPRKSTRNPSMSLSSLDNISTTTSRNTDGSGGWRPGSTSRVGGTTSFTAIKPATTITMST